MDTKRFLIILVAILSFSAIIGYAGSIYGITYTDYVHAAIKIGDGKNSNLSGTGIGNGWIADVYCVQNCSGRYNTTNVGTETNASNLTSGTVADARLPSTITKNISAKIVNNIYNASAYASIQDAINASSGAGGGVVLIPIGNYTLSKNFTIGGTINVSMYIPKNVIVRGSGYGTILKQSDNLNSHDMIAMSGDNSAIEDLTLDFNGFNQNYQVAAGTFYSAIVTGETSNRAKNVRVENIKIINATGQTIDSDLNINAITLFNSPNAVIKNIECDTFDQCIFVTRAFNNTISDYSISDIYSNNGTGYGVYYEAGDANIQNLITNNSYPFQHIGYGNASISKVKSRNMKGVVRFGTDAADVKGTYSDLDLEGYGISIASYVRAPFNIVNPTINNGVGDCILLTSANGVIIKNPQITNCTNSGIHFESSTNSQILGGNVSKAAYHGIYMNTASNNNKISDIFLINNSQGSIGTYSGVAFASNSNNSLVTGAIINGTAHRYSIDEVSGKNYVFGNLISTGTIGYYTRNLGNFSWNFEN